MSDSTLSASVDPSSEPVSSTVVTGVAAVKNVDPIDLPPLYYAIDPDALDGLFQPHCSASETVRVQFTFAGCDVVVDGDSRVTVTPADAAIESDLEA